jgi:hypothetical protein
MPSTTDLNYMHTFVPASSDSSFKSGGADVAISSHQGGRELGEDDVSGRKELLARDRFRKELAA